MFGMVKLQKMHIKDVGLLMVFVLLFCSFLRMQRSTLKRKSRMERKNKIKREEEERFQKQKRKIVGWFIREEKVTMFS